MMKAVFSLIVLALGLSLGAHGAWAQSSNPPADPPLTAEQHGGQTLEDILARQRGEGEARAPRERFSADSQASEIAGQLGLTGGGASDSELWEALRFGTADINVSSGGPAAGTIMQNSGMWWYDLRTGPLSKYGTYLLLGTLALLALFFLIRGRIKVPGGMAGRTLLRFTAIERFAHWLLAGSFILLGITGLVTLFGRKGLIPYIGKDGFATLALYSKWIHNNVSWAFILALVLIFVFWVVHNLPSRHDVTWFLKGGGIIGNAHPAAKKFNAGQKIIFWSVIVLGGSISASGVSLLFPFEFPMFAKSFHILNHMGVHLLYGGEPLPTTLSPHAEMQYAQLWHEIVSFVMMEIILAHI